MPPAHDTPPPGSLVSSSPPADDDSEVMGAKPIEMSWGDWVMKDRPELLPQHQLICHMKAQGAKTEAIAATLGLTPARVGVVLSNTKVRARIKELQDTHGGAALAKKFEQSAPEAFAVFEETVKPGAPYKQETRLTAATWILEKITGKAKPAGTEDTGNLVLQLLQAVDQLRRPVGSTPTEGSQEIDVTPVEPPNAIDAWVDKNLGDP